MKRNGRPIINPAAKRASVSTNQRNASITSASESSSSRRIHPISSNLRNSMIYSSHSSLSTNLLFSRPTSETSSSSSSRNDNFVTDTSSSYVASSSNRRPSNVVEIESNIFREFNYLPKCKVGLGLIMYAFKNSKLERNFFVKGSRDKQVSILPSFLCNYSVPHNENLFKKKKEVALVLKDFESKNPKFVEECVNDISVVLSLSDLDSGKNERRNDLLKANFPDHFENQFSLELDQPCSKCFQSDVHRALSDQLSQLEYIKFLTNKYYMDHMDSGNSLEDCSNAIKNLNDEVFKSRGGRTQEIDRSAELERLASEKNALKAETDALKRIIIDYHESYSQNIRENAAFLYYYLNISQRQLRLLDRNVFCNSNRNKELIEIVESPEFLDLTKIKPSDCHDLLFEEYLNHIKEYKQEPKFNDLGTRYALVGDRGGESPSRRTQLAQSICYRKLIALKDIDPASYNLVAPIARASYNKRQGYESYTLCDAPGLNLHYPRVPALREAIKQINEMEDKGLISLGLPHVQKHQTYDHNSQEWKDITSVARKNSLNSLRTQLLQQHLKDDLLRAKSSGYYDKLSRSDALNTLESYGVMYPDSARLEPSGGEISAIHPTLKELQGLVKYLESHRPYLIWYDHATLGGMSYILFNFSYIYTRAAYKSDKYCERDLQHIIEEPRTYFIGLSKSTTINEEAFRTMRLDDIKLMGTPIVRNNISYYDVYRFTTGDNPVRTVEAGRNKNGFYRLATSDFRLPLRTDTADPGHVHQRQSGNSIKISDAFTLTYEDIVKSNHQTVQMQCEFANKGGYFEIEGNEGKSLLEKANAQDVCAKRYNKKKITQAEGHDFLKGELKGCKHQPILLMGQLSEVVPEKPLDLSLLNLDHWQILPSEPMHDLKEMVKSLIANIPGKTKPSYESFSEVHESRQQYEKRVESVDNCLKVIRGAVNMVGDEVHLLKAEHSAEDQFKFLIDITSKLEHAFFSHELDRRCVECKATVFQLTGTVKCVKCIVVGIYRSLLEIHVLGYQDHSKKTCLNVLRLYNLVYIFFTYLSYFSRSFPNADMHNICSNVYFFNVIRYFPIMYELHNLLSFNAGRHEGQFKTIKKVVDNYSNKHHFDDHFVLHLMRKLEVRRYLGGRIDGHVTSAISKKITKHFEKSPQTPIIFDQNYIEKCENTASFLALIEQISTFVISNKDNNYFKISSEGIKFFVHSERAKYPPYPIYNVLMSSIELILQTKNKVYTQFEGDKILGRDSIDFNKLMSVCHGDPEGERAIEHRENLAISTTFSVEDLQTREMNNLLAVSNSELLDRLKEVGFDRPTWCATGQSLFNSELSFCLASIMGNTVSDSDKSTIHKLEERIKYNEVMARKGAGSFMRKKAMLEYAERLDSTISILDRREIYIKEEIFRINSLMNSQDDDDREDSGNLFTHEVEKLDKYRVLLEVLSTARDKLNYTLQSVRRG